MTYAFDPALLPLMEFLPAVEMDNPATAREVFSAMTSAMNADLDTSGVHIADHSFPGANDAPPVTVRVYTPEGASEATAGLIYLHGGGFVLGSLDSEHAICVKLCREVGIVLISVDYRLSPETAYPGPLEDCYAALQWASDNASQLHIDSSRIGIGGQSAGGCLAAAVTLMARDQQGPLPCFQLLSIPVLDDRLDSPSMRQFTDTPVWDRSKAEKSWAHYLGTGYRAGAGDVPVYAAPARCQDLSGLPPTYISTMEFDPLRDEALQFAMRLLEAGVQTEVHNYPGTFHGSSAFGEVGIHQRESADMRAALRAGLKVDQ